MKEVFYKEDENGNTVYEKADYPGKTSLKKRKRPVVDHYGDKIFEKITEKFEHLGYNIYYKVYDTVSGYVELLKKRNILAHVSQTQDDDIFIFKARASGENDYVLSEKECLKLRQAIWILSNALEQIHL